MQRPFLLFPESALPESELPETQAYLCRSMRWFVSFLLLSAFSLQQGLKLGVLGWWLWNRQEIARTLCENRDKPELDCCGKCVLNKKLSQADKAPQKNSDKDLVKKTAREEPAVLTPEVRISVAWVLIFPESAWPRYTATLLSGIPEGVFHPPQA